MAKKSLDSRTSVLTQNQRRSKRSKHTVDNSMVVSKKGSGVITLRRKTYRADILRRRELKIGGFSRSYIESFNASLAEIASDMPD